MRFLIIEDDPEAARYIGKGLEEEGHIIDLAADGATGLNLARTAQYDALIIDRMLPEIDGLNIISTLRKEKNNTPVLILSALGEVDHKVDGLRAGGDDYLTKPYAFTELTARLEALVRRHDPDSAKTNYCVEDLEIDLLKREVIRSGKKILLQPREFLLLQYLMKNHGKVITRTMLLEQVWDYHFDPQTNIIDVHISRLRSKIDKGFFPPLLHTIRGVGYRLGKQ